MLSVGGGLVETRLIEFEAVGQQDVVQVDGGPDQSDRGVGEFPVGCPQTRLLFGKVLVVLPVVGIDAPELAQYGLHDRVLTSAAKLSRAFAALFAATALPWMASP